MRKVPKSFLALGALAGLLGGCAAYDPYYAYDDAHYDRAYYDRTYYERPYYYDYGPRYYGPRVYAAPSVSLGFSYHRGWRR